MRNSCAASLSDPLETRSGPCVDIQSRLWCRKAFRWGSRQRVHRRSLTQPLLRQQGPLSQARVRSCFRPGRDSIPSISSLLRGLHAQNSGPPTVESAQCLGLTDVEDEDEGICFREKYRIVLAGSTVPSGRVSDGGRRESRRTVAGIHLV